MYKCLTQDQYTFPTFNCSTPKLPDTTFAKQYQVVLLTNLCQKLFENVIKYYIIYYLNI